MTIQVWYHGACDDGFGAAWACHKFFSKHRPLAEVRYVPCFYGKEPPEYKQSDLIYIVDFSFKRDIITKIKEGVSRLTILDHHKTAQEDLKDFPGAIFDMDRSGAVIAWSYFHADPVPLLLRYVQANDLWKHDSMKHTQAVVRFIRTVPHDFREWDQLNTLFETDLGGTVKQAIAIEKYFQNQIAFNASIAQIIEFEGHRCPVINCNTTFVSEMCHHLHKKHNTEIAMSFFIDQEGYVIWSLRSAGNVDVSAIAKKFGGGGHHNAAGFKTQIGVLHAILTQVKEQNNYE